MTASDSRGHVLYDAVEQVKTLVVVGLGGNKLLENSKQARLGAGEEKGKNKGCITTISAVLNSPLCARCRNLLFCLQQRWK